MQRKGHLYIYFSPISLQKGVFRTNCMDCLDRTNVVQSYMNKEALADILSKLGLLRYANETCLHIRAVARGQGLQPPQCLTDQLTLSQPGGRLCPPQYYQPPKIFRPCDGPAASSITHIKYMSESETQRGENYIFLNFVAFF